MKKFMTGTVTGTGADIDIETGFKPDYVKVYNKTVIAGGAAEANYALEYFEGLGDGAAIQHNIAIPYDNGSATAETKAANVVFAGTGGISILESSTVQTTDPVTLTGSVGFQIPAAFQSVSDELYYVASRN